MFVHESVPCYHQDAQGERSPDASQIKLRSHCPRHQAHDPEEIFCRREDTFLEGLRGEESISVICRREGISPNLYYRWSKEFLEAGKRRLNGDTQREATSGEVVDLRRENEQLKQLVAELSLKNRVLKKSLHGMG